MILFLLLGFILGAGVIIFILQNTSVVALSFLGWQFESTIAVIVILSVLVGIVLALLLTLPSAVGSSLAIRRLQKHNDALTREALAKQQADQAAAAHLSTHSVTQA